MSKGIKTRRLGVDGSKNHLGGVRALNSESSAIAAGKLVHVVSHDEESRLPQVLLSAADSHHQPTHVAMTMFAAGPTGTERTGILCDWFLVEDLDTSGADVGDPVYLSSAGGYTLTAPGGVQVGEVSVSHATKGQIRLEPSRYALGGGLLTRVVDIAASAVAALNATPVTIIPAPGAGNYIEVDSAIVQYDFGTAAYNAVAAGDDFQLRYQNGSGAQVINEVTGPNFADSTADEVRFRKGIDVDPTPHVNHPVVAFVSAGEWGAGDGTLSVTIRYRVVDL